eukprot:TRINITY_DN8544_c0_g1_i1.p1 TRINITY_DN8544_c0_g1~~TRINITY_DN8544_c0_g1_i1.p1  ORF type:complete len:311 (-),score=37.13 TRINITY_DN8544_c0_g1_i1:361-1293(-)
MLCTWQEFAFITLGLRFMGKNGSSVVLQLMLHHRLQAHKLVSSGVLQRVHTPITSTALNLVTALSRAAVADLNHFFCASREWRQDRYDPFTRNCNHFSAQYAAALHPRLRVPAWVNRAANLGHCLLPVWSRRFVTTYSRSVADEECAPSEQDSKRIQQAVAVTAAAVAAAAGAAAVETVSAADCATTPPTLPVSVNRSLPPCLPTIPAGFPPIPVDKLPSTLADFGGAFPNLPASILQSLPSGNADSNNLWYQYAEAPTCPPPRGSYMTNASTTTCPGHPKYNLSKAASLPLPPMKKPPNPSDLLKTLVS